MEQPGTLGRYQLLRVLGRGAMGVVYEGIDPKLNRQVAVKTILKSQLVDPGLAAEYTARFMREAQAVARLNHPNIVQVFDFGNEADVTYLVMEFIRGKELKGYLEEKRLLGVDEVVQIVGDLLQALDYAHEHGVIHRDIKPANVMLDGAGRVKLTDFGVARLSDSGGSEATKAGTMVGTPGYMAPEQIKGLSVGPQADIFATGVLLYQCLTLQKPFTGTSDWEVYHKIVNEDPPPLSQFRGGIPPALEAVVRRALAKEPKDRYPSAGVMASELRLSVSGKTFDDEATRLVYDPRAAAPTADRTHITSSTTAAQTGTRVGTSDAERDFWNSIKDSGDIEELREFLVQFPDSIFANLARIRINKLSGQNTGVDTSALKIAEGEAQIKALEETRKKEREEARIKAEEEAKRQVESERQRRAQKDAQRQVEEETRRRAEQEARKKAEADAAKGGKASPDKLRDDGEAHRQEEARQRAEEEDRRLKAEVARKAEQQKQAELEARRKAEEAERLRAAEEAERRAQEDARLKAEAEAKRRAEEEARRHAEEEARRKADLEAQRRTQEAARQRAEEDARRKAEEKARNLEIPQEDGEDSDRTVVLGRSRPPVAPATARPVEQPVAADLPDSALSPLTAGPLGAPAARAAAAEATDQPQYSTLDLPGKKSKMPIVIGGVAVAVIAAGALMFMGGGKNPPPETPKAAEAVHAPAPAAAPVQDPGLKQKQEAAQKAEEQRAAEAELQAQEAKRQAADAGARQKAEENARKQAQAEQARAEAKAKADEARRADEARKADEARRKDEARRADEARKKDEARKAEETRKKEEARKAEEAKKEEARKAFESSPDGILKKAREARKAKNSGEAIKLYAEAYNKGSGLAAKELGDYYSAAGPDQDPDAAALWYNRAKQKGVKTGK
ncbi:MAG: protein kinase [Rhodocyclaceae bacterium]|nr:protein kinase [Rhodocyclaceae bacterium]